MEEALMVVLPLVIFFFIDIYFLVDSFKQGIDTITQRFFAQFLFCATLIQGLTALSYAFDKKLIPANRGLQYICNFASLMCMSLAALVWFIYLLHSANILKTGKTRKHIYFLGIPCMLLFLAGCISPWTHWILYIDEKGVFQNGTIGLLELIPYWYIVAALVVVVVEAFRKKNMAGLMAKFLLFVIPSVLGAMANMLLVRGGYTQIGCSLGAILMYFQQYTAEKNEIKSKRNIGIVSSLSKSYMYIFYIDLKTEEYVRLDRPEEIVGTKHDGREKKARDKFEEMCRIFVEEEYRQQVVDFAELSTVTERLRERDIIEYQFKCTEPIGWCVGEFIACSRDEEGNCTHVLWAIRSVNAQKLAEKEQQEKLQKALEAAQKASEAKTIFLNNMSHDIRTPMNAILGFTELMESKKDDPEGIQDYIEKIKYSGEYLLTIINNVLDMARIESGNITIDESFMDLFEEERKISSTVLEMTKKKNQKLIIKNNISHRYITVDPAKQQEIIMNLVSNAIKYTPEGGTIEIVMDELPSSSPEYAKLRLTVCDSGIGMPPEFIEHIFEAFSREKNTTDCKIAGTGLGMAIVKKLVDLFGGTIEIESEVGKGSKFIVTVEHRIVEKPEEYLKEQENKRNNQSTGAHRILLAEDNDFNAEIATEILKLAGIETERAADGVECIDMLTKADDGYYDLILMDIQMPNLNGYEATRRIRALNDEKKAGIPIIAMTANAFEEDRNAAIDAGMNAHISKPVNIDKIVNTINEVTA